MNVRRSVARVSSIRQGSAHALLRIPACLHQSGGLCWVTIAPNAQDCSAAITSELEQLCSACLRPAKPAPQAGVARAAAGSGSGLRCARSDPATHWLSFLGIRRSVVLSVQRERRARRFSRPTETEWDALGRGVRDRIATPVLCPLTIARDRSHPSPFSDGQLGSPHAAARLPSFAWRTRPSAVQGLPSAQPRAHPAPRLFRPAYLPCPPRQAR